MAHKVQAANEWSKIWALNVVNTPSSNQRRKFQEAYCAAVFLNMAHMNHASFSSQTETSASLNRQEKRWKCMGLFSNSWANKAMHAKLGAHSLYCPLSKTGLHFQHTRLWTAWRFTLAPFFQHVYNYPRRSNSSGMDRFQNNFHL